MAVAAGSGDGGNKGAKLVTVISSDNARFEVDEAAASLSRLMMTTTEGVITVANVDAVTLAKVLEYCNMHACSVPAASSASSNSEELERFDRELLVSVGSATLVSLMKAAHYLGVEGLTDITCQKAANMIAHMTLEEIRLMFGIPNEFASGEEEEIRRHNTWAFK